MKILLINGSPKKSGSTDASLRIVADELQAAGIETEIIHVGHKSVHGCIGCFKCFQTGKCVFDDVVNEVAEKFRAAEGMVIGAPVYFAGMPGTLKSFLDRLFFSLNADDKRMKVGAAVVTSRRSGSVTTFDAINHYFTHGEMPVASSRYWNEIHANGHSEDINHDEEGKQVLRVLGRNMAFLVKSIALGKEQIGLPEKEQRISTNFIR